MRTLSIGVDVGSKGAVTIVDRDDPKYVRFFALHAPGDVKNIWQFIHGDALNAGALVLLSIEKVNGSSLMTPSACFHFGMSYGVALSHLFDLARRFRGQEILCGGIRVFTPAGWQSFFKTKSTEEFSFPRSGPREYEERKKEWDDIARKLCSDRGIDPLPKYAADSFLIALAGLSCAGLNERKSATFYPSEKEYYDHN